MLASVALGLGVLSMFLLGGGLLMSLFTVDAPASDQAIVGTIAGTLLIAAAYLTWWLVRRPRCPHCVKIIVETYSFCPHCGNLNLEPPNPSRDESTTPTRTVRISQEVRNGR